MASAEEPLYLTVGTDVSAKYRGAFCEAKIKKVQRMVKCRVTFKNNQGTHLVPDDHIRGALRIGAHVEAKHPDKSQFLEAVIGKLLDYSQYTVVFDDGDETTLRRTSLCLKSGRHFAESETLDQLPLTNPEHFGTPVMGSKAKRKRRSAAAASLPLEEDSSEEESVPPQRSRGGSCSWPLATVGRVVCLEGDRRKKDSWLPALVVSPGQEGILTNRDECLVRSFKDGKYYQVPKRHLRQFSRDGVPQRVENGTLKVALERAQAYLEKGELPANWDAQVLLRGDVSVKDDDDDDDEDGADDVSDDEPSEEKDRFVAQLYKFMDERGTPINKGPAINGQDLNLYRLFRLVGQLGGGNRVSNQSQWRRVYTRLGLPVPANQANAHLLRNSYKKYLQSFEDFYRKLGCTMDSHPRGGVSCRGSVRSPRHHRVLTRNQDRGLALFAPPPAKEKKEVAVKEEESTATTKEETGRSSVRAADDTKVRRTREKNSSDSGNGATTRRSSSEPSSGASGGTQQPDNSTERPRGSARRDTPPPNITTKRNWRKKLDESIERADEDSSSGGGSSSTAGGADGSSEGESIPPRSRGPLEVAIGDRVRVKYGRGRQLKVYEAKVLRVEDDGPDRRFYVHYTGWNMRYDEWVRKNRIVENVTDKTGRRKRILKDVPDTPPGSNKRGVASRGGVRRGRPPGSMRGVPPRPTSAGSGTRGRRRSGALGYESGGNSDESSQQTAATPQEEELLKTAKEEPEEDIDDRESGASSPCSTDQADARDQTSPLPGMVQEEQGTKEEEKEKEEEDEDTDIDEDASVAARPPSADGERDSRANEDTRGEEQEVEGDQTLEEGREEEEDSLSGNLLIYEESSTAEELDVEKDEVQGVTVEEPSAETPMPTVKEEEAIGGTPLAEEEVKAKEEHHESPSVETAAQNDEAQDSVSLQATAAAELEADFLHESEVKEEPLICEEVIQESNSEVEMECKVEDAKDEVEDEKKMEQGELVTVKEEAVPELEPSEEVKHEEISTEPIVEEPLYEEADEIVEMEGEPMTKTVQEIVESALEALETTEAEELETASPCQDIATSVEVKKEEVVIEKTETKEGEGEAPTAKVKKKKGPRMKKNKLEVAGQKRLKKRSRKLHDTVERRQLVGAQVGTFSKRRKMGMRGRRREDAAGSSREAAESVAEPDDFLSTLAEVCSGQGSSLKEQPVAAESADALFLLCEEKVPASPLHSAADLSVPVLENTPPTTPDDSEGTSSEAASPHRSSCGHAGGSTAPGVASFLDAESTLSAEGDSENSQGLADLKGEGEDSSSSRTTDSGDALKSGVKRTASGAALPDLDEMAAVQTDSVSTSPVQTTLPGSKRSRKSATPRMPSRCEPGMKARQPRSVLKARDMFMGSSLENTEMGLRRPSKFHFDAPLDEDMEPEQRINVLQDRMSELRKVYTALKAEVALIDRRRKRAKKKDGGTPGAPDTCTTPEAHSFS